MQLTFDEKAILTLYRRFYQQEYPAQGSNNRDAHVMAQKMGYILSEFSIYAGDYGYMWDSFGPCSPALQEELRFLDKHHEEVKDFYRQNPDDKKLFTAEDDYSGLFTIEQGNQIDLVARKLRLKEHSEDLRNWSELLGSLAYIYLNNMPDSSFQEISSELDNRKTQYRDPKLKRRAWNALSAAKVV